MRSAALEAENEHVLEAVDYIPFKESFSKFTVRKNALRGAVCDVRCQGTYAVPSLGGKPIARVAAVSCISVG